MNEQKRDARRSRKTMQGTVVSDRMSKTAVVRVERYVRQRTFGKYLRRSKRYKAHDEKDECRTGDIVRIMETRPISKDKRWRIVGVVRKASAV